MRQVVEQSTSMDNSGTSQKGAVTTHEFVQNILHRFKRDIIYVSLLIFKI